MSIDGRTITSPVEQTVQYNGVTRNISQICAEFSAASVDAVKDPVLSLIYQVPDNAFIAGGLARLGFDEQRIAALFSNPLLNILFVRNPNFKEYFKQMDIILGNAQVQDSSI